MRLYLSPKEAQLVRASLLVSMATMNKGQQDIANRVLDRIDMCEKLQDSEWRAKADANK